MLRRDYVDHIEAKHLESESSEEENNDNNVYRDRVKVRKRDLLDNYTLERDLEAEEKAGIVVQDPTGGNRLRSEKLESKWSEFISKLENEGEVKVSSNQHKGKLRGNDIVTRFIQDFKRMDLGFDVSADYGKKRSVVRKV